MMKHNNKVLYLTLKKKWFDMISSGEKKEEYREIKSYWLKRLFSYHDHAILDINTIDDVINELNGKLYSVDELYRWTGWKQKDFDYICFRNGYKKDAPEVWCVFEGITIKPARPEWSDGATGFFFTLGLGYIVDNEQFK